MSYGLCNNIKREFLPQYPSAKGINSREHTLDNLGESGWAELPYAMMRLTTNSTFRGNDFYWRDQDVTLGEVELHLTKTQAKDHSATYGAIFTSNDSEFDFPLYPSLEGNALRWTVPGICDPQKTTTEQLAEKLLNELMNLQLRGLS